MWGKITKLTYGKGSLKQKPKMIKWEIKKQQK